MTSGTMPLRGQRAQHADMGKAARGAAAERKPDARARRGRLGRRVVASADAVAVAHARKKSLEHQRRISPSPRSMIEPGPPRDKHFTPIW